MSCILALFCGCAVKQPISKEKAVVISKTYIINDDKSKIINYNNPIVEIVNFSDGKSYNVYFESSKKDLKGLSVYKITYTTELDALLGPINIYIDSYSGKIYGFDLRM